ncbi:hypothetical protein SLEP1_g43150 [Rubroshorea leprosula]|uniref:Uncharacterized protein n=1 Tax=Rubroshorea leprosula TaxID=152421 RepID=A0AAV5LD13_9ROSI|nr:hypothetical protein SLEP1_g43150 [Rubroshorea leprosula]
MVGVSILLHGARFVDDLTEVTGAWFVLELTASGTEVKEAFQGIPNLEDFRLFDSTCALVGHYLCVIGGRGHTMDTLRSGH